MKTIYKSQFSPYSGEHIRFCSKTGNGKEPHYQMEKLPNGDARFIRNGIDDIYNFIQSFKDECSIEYIIQNFTKDPRLLSARDGLYLDVSEMPDNFLDAYQLVTKLTNEFNALPVEERREFGFDPLEYIKDLDNKNMDIQKGEDIDVNKEQ